MAPRRIHGVGRWRSGPCRARRRRAGACDGAGRNGPGVALPGAPATVVAAAIEAAVGDGDVAAVAVEACRLRRRRSRPEATVAAAPASQATRTRARRSPRRRRHPGDGSQSCRYYGANPDTTSDTPAKAAQPAPSSPRALPAGRGGAGVAEQRQRERPRREPGRQRPRHPAQPRPGVAVTAPAVRRRHRLAQAAQRPKRDRVAARRERQYHLADLQQYLRPIPAARRGTGSGTASRFLRSRMISPAVPMLVSRRVTGYGTGTVGQIQPQYQGETAGQYHPVNVNVGVRLSSPGNDGPVTQTNVVVAIGPGTDPVRRADPTPAPGRDARLDACSGGAPLAPAPPKAALARPARSRHRRRRGRDRRPTANGRSHRAVARHLAVERRPCPRSRAGRVGSGQLPFVPACDETHCRRCGWPRSAPGQPAERCLRASSRSRARRRGAGGGHEGCAPLDTLAGIRGSITRQSSGTSVAPAGVGSSSSGGLPLVLALPFLVAVLDMARRLALDRVATPSGHRSRVPDDPG